MASARKNHAGSNEAAPPAAPGQQVRRRLVLNFPGFEPTDSVAQIGRLRYCADHTGKIWGFSVSGEAGHWEEGTHHALAELSADGGNWHTDMRLIQFRWNDIVHAYERDSFPGGFLKNLGKYFAFFFDGTVRRYRKASWRYWGFTIYPLLLALIFFAVVFAALWLATGSIWISFAVSLVATLLACKWPGNRLYVPTTIADWGFARDMVDRSNPEIEGRFAEFGKTIVEEITASDHDEIVIVGHSFGSLWAVTALALALGEKPDLLTGRRVAFLALGSSMLKIALAPGARHIRDHWQRLAREENLFWHEIQTKDDLIAFYKCDPFEEVAIAPPAQNEAGGGYKITRIRFSKGVAKKRYRKMRKSFYTTHRQYILYYDKRVSFDYMLRLFGPFSVRSLADGGDVPDWLDKDGSIRA